MADVTSSKNVQICGFEAPHNPEISGLQPGVRRNWGRWRENLGLGGDEWKRSIGFERGHLVEKRPFFTRF
jgi:hypothetical protein